MTITWSGLYAPDSGTKSPTLFFSAKVLHESFSIFSPLGTFYNNRDVLHFDFRNSHDFRWRRRRSRYFLKVRCLSVENIPEVWLFSVGKISRSRDPWNPRTFTCDWESCDKEAATPHYARALVWKTIFDTEGKTFHTHNIPACLSRRKLEEYPSARSWLAQFFLLNLRTVIFLQELR